MPAVTEHGEDRMSADRRTPTVANINLIQEFGPGASEALSLDETNGAMLATAPLAGEQCTVVVSLHPDNDAVETAAWLRRWCPALSPWPCMNARLGGTMTAGPNTGTTCWGCCRGTMPPAPAATSPVTEGETEATSAALKPRNARAHADRNHRHHCHFRAGCAGRSALTHRLELLETMNHG
jgi:hypothetical protein